MRYTSGNFRENMDKTNILTIDITSSMQINTK